MCSTCCISLYSTFLSSSLTHQLTCSHCSTHEAMRDSMYHKQKSMEHSTATLRHNCVHPGLDSCHFTVWVTLRLVHTFMSAHQCKHSHDHTCDWDYKAPTTEPFTELVSFYLCLGQREHEGLCEEEC